MRQFPSRRGAGPGDQFAPGAISGDAGMPFDFVYLPAASPDQARAIGRILVTERLAACANVFDGMSSCYWWEGKVTEARESVLIAKTRSDLVPSVIARAKGRPTHSGPC